MAYRKRYEDSYLDEEDEEFNGSDKTDAERIVALLEKETRTLKEDGFIEKLTQRLFAGARLPGPPGEQAILGIEIVASTYEKLGLPDTAAALWEKLADIAGMLGNKELYYKAMDAMTALSGETYEEYHDGAATSS